MNVWPKIRQLDDGDWRLVLVLGVLALLLAAVAFLGVAVIVHGWRALHRQPVDGNVGVVESISGSGNARTIVHTSRADIIVNKGFSAMHGAALEVQIDGNGDQFLCLAGGGDDACAAIVGAGWRAGNTQ